VQYVKMLSDYGPLKKDRTYALVNTGFDYFNVRYNGRLICIPDTTGYITTVKSEEPSREGWFSERLKHSHS